MAKTREFDRIPFAEITKKFRQDKLNANTASSRPTKRRRENRTQVQFVRPVRRRKQS